MDDLPQLALVCIVKNEAKTLPRLVASLRGMIDYWVIVDTGSTDNTINVLQFVFNGIPGELHERTWVNFGHNRTELMNLAKGKAQWLLCMDADEVVINPVVVNDLNPIVTQYYAESKRTGYTYWLPRIVRGDLDWEWVGPVHEYLNLKDRQVIQADLHDLLLGHYDDGGTRHINRKEILARDRILLEQEIVQNHSDARSWFYLGQTLSEMFELDDAITAYKMRVKLGGWMEEVYYSQYRIGEILKIQGHFPEAIIALLQAWEIRPSRLEAVHAAVCSLRQQAQYQSAFALAEAVVGTQVSNDRLFVNKNVWLYELPLEHSICAYYVRGPAICLFESEALLSLSNLPIHVHDFAESNVKLCRKVLAKD